MSETETGQTAQQALSDEVLRKIGRNLLLLQHIEHLLKSIWVRSRIRGTASDLMTHQEQRRNKTQKQMMGPLVKMYVRDILSDTDEVSQEQEDPSVPSVSFSFTTNGDPELYESQRTNLKLIVDERNDLIHHFLPRWQPDSLDHIKDASAYLDKQREKVLPMLEHLKSVSKSMREGMQKLADFLASDHLELLWLQQSPLISLLHDIASKNCRPDGWTDLAHAGQLVRVHECDEVENMKERYGYSTLKKLLVASKLFEMFDEPLLTRGSRTLYRVRQKQHH